MIKVSVIIPAYNVEKFIIQAVQSVQTQTLTDFEIIIVNDGSTDQTLPLIESLAEQDRRIHVYNQRNSGRPSIARNVGLSKAKGEYICFLDGDDFYKPTKLEKQSTVLDQFPEFDVVFNDIDVVDINGKIIHNSTYLQRVNFQEKAGRFFNKKGDSIYELSKQFYNFMSTQITALHTSSIMIRKDKLMSEKVWFPDDMLIGEDIDLWFRLVKGEKIMFIDEPLSFYRQHCDSITKDNEKMLKGSILAHTRNFHRAFDVLSVEESSQYKCRIASQYSILGYLYFTKNMMSDARKAYLKAMQWKGSYRTILHLTKTFAPKWLINLYREFGRVTADGA